jgi:hypothetical protein
MVLGAGASANASTSAEMMRYGALDFGQLHSGAIAKGSYGEAVAYCSPRLATTSPALGNPIIITQPQRGCLRDSSPPPSLFLPFFKKILSFVPHSLFFAELIQYATPSISIHNHTKMNLPSKPPRARPSLFSPSAHLFPPIPLASPPPGHASLSPGHASPPPGHFHPTQRDAHPCQRKISSRKVTFFSLPVTRATHKVTRITFGRDARPPSPPKTSPTPQKTSPPAPETSPSR